MGGGGVRAENSKTKRKKENHQWGVCRVMLIPPPGLRASQ